MNETVYGATVWFVRKKKEMETRFPGPKGGFHKFQDTGTNPDGHAPLPFHSERVDPEALVLLTKLKPPPVTDTHQWKQLCLELVKSVWYFQPKCISVDEQLVANALYLLDHEIKSWWLALYDFVGAKKKKKKKKYSALI
eukprot:Trichotokara_eunicae@DN5614_c0_g1_i2.p1